MPLGFGRHKPRDASTRFKGEELIGTFLATLQDIRGDRVAYVLQDPLGLLNPRKTVRQILKIPLRSLRGMRPPPGATGCRN